MARVDVVALVNDAAERLGQLPPDTSPTDVLAQAHNGFGALTLAAAVLSGQTSSPAVRDEYAAISLAVLAAHEHIAAVVDEQVLDAVIDARVITLLEDADNLRRIRASARYLRAAAIQTAEATHTVLARIAASDNLAPAMAEEVRLTIGIISDIRTLFDGPAGARAAVAEAILQRMTVDE
ncbi:hypothetical protein ACWELJ_21315 [Nocardia sp. NPDC004582]